MYLLCFVGLHKFEKSKYIYKKRNPYGLKKGDWYFYVVCKRCGCFKKSDIEVDKKNATKRR